eukprot:TRINITY_DN3483_c0_g2_i1.p3 TRINITY_DN3483_c0_g2~~TRINITY_DN3483_c0_g2_i1.p3  ORF type:complete len:158 (+),score=37.43 TRINITY_DN3483_c0_g2_i1:324-797(+)
MERKQNRIHEWNERNGRGSPVRSGDNWNSRNMEDGQRNRPWTAGSRGRDGSNNSRQRDGSTGRDRPLSGNQDRRFNGRSNRSARELRDMVKVDLQRWQAASGDALMGNSTIMLKQACPHLTDEEVQMVLDYASESGGLGQAAACDSNALFSWIFEEA